MADLKLGAIVAVALLVGSAVGAGVVTVGISGDASTTDGPSPDDSVPDDTGPGDPTPVNDGSADEAGVTKFDGESEFRTYLRNGKSSGRANQMWLRPGASRLVETALTFDGQESERRVADSDDASPSRHSSTNVQEIGIDEPDLLKTTGEYLYYASKPRIWYPTWRTDGESDDELPTGETHVVDAADPGNPEKIAGINESGDLLLSGSSLVLLQGDRLVGYDVSDPAAPERTWTRSINGTVETARLTNGTVYLVTRSPVSPGMDCPVEPLSGPGGAIACTDIYRPNRQIPVDVTYTAFSLTPGTGEITDSVSAVGTADRSTIYMSGDSLYLTYTERTPRGELLIDAALSDEIDVPDWVETRLREIRSYNLTARATEIETRATINEWLGSLPDEERETVREAVYNNVTIYVQDHRRELVTTGVVRIGTGDGLSVEATGQVPGEPLNQFSMDEHNGTLRVAATIPRQFGTESVNDLYTLDAESLDRTGSVTGMGIDERVYAVRYVGETAYVVTFRQIDPFHVVDLSDPADPEEVGELELPGYSSYLHPIDDDHVLGIGEEDGTVKTVLFNVSDPGDPAIEDTYYPEARWSAISQSHHAFLIDRRHGVFFLPGGDSGFVVDYTDGDLDLDKRVPVEGQARRAAYIDDYLYVFSDNELVVVDETDWSRTHSLRLDSR
ncbi:MAG: beta-propeller domain-containing protein [Halapricum sp.]